MGKQMTFKNNEWTFRRRDARWDSFVAMSV